MIGTVEERLSELRAEYPEYVPHTLWTRFRENARRYGERTFLIYQDRPYSYEEILGQTEKMARSLYALGVRAGNHVAVIMRNCPEYIALIFAIAKLGATKVSVNVKISSNEMAYMLKKAEVRYVISALPLKEDLLSAVSCVNTWITPDSWEAFQRMGENVSAQFVNAYCKQHQNPDAKADIMFTSGSSSFPKGVILTHDMILRSSFGTVWSRRMEFGRKVYVPIPLYHVFAYLEGLIPMVYVGGTIVLSKDHYDPFNAAALMKKHRVNDIVCVSYIMMDILLKVNPQPEDFEEMHAAYWASSCPKWVWEAGRKGFGIMDVTTGYGMTECGSTTTVTRPEAPEDFVEWNNGRLKEAGPMGDPENGGRLQQVRIVDPETRADSGMGKAGEIWCKGLTVTPGYYLSPAENQKAFTEDGWFLTGDLATVDADGNLTFAGRIGDAYKINGEMVSPAQIDHILGGCPEISSVEVVGIKDNKCGECGAAFIDAGVLSEDKERNIIRFCRENLASFEIPKYLIFSRKDYWPRTGSGKIIKKSLCSIAQRLCDGNQGDAGGFIVKKIV